MGVLEDTIDDLEKQLGSRPTTGGNTSGGPTGGGGGSSNAPTRRTPGGLEQHLSTGATGHEVTINEGNGQKRTYGLYENNVPPGTLVDAQGRPVRGGGGGYTPPPPPPPRPAYGPYLAGDLAARTIGLDEKTRVDPYSGTRYVMGNDGTWKESGGVGRQQLEDLRAAGALPPVAQDMRNATINGPQLSANPALRGGAGTAGLGGTLGPQDTPQFSSLNQFMVPGLGFNAADYRPGTDFNLSNVRLPTGVATRPYGFDFSSGNFPGMRTSGPAAVGVDMPKYSVPNGYLGGPSGFSQQGPNGPYFQAFNLPINVANPTFSPLSQSAPPTVEAPSRANNYEPAPLGPGDLKPAGMTGAGGAAAIQMSGPQTAEIRGGGVGMGWNPDTILKDFGRGSPSDPAGKAVASMALMNAQQAMMNNPQAPMATPLDAYLAMQQPSMSNYGAPTDRSQGQAAAAQASAQQSADDARRREEDAMYGGDGRNFGFAQGGTVEMIPAPKGPEHYRPFARGGEVTAPVKTTDEGGMPLNQQPWDEQQKQQNQNFQGFAAGGSVVAPIKTTEEQGGIVPTGQQQNTQQTPMAQPAAQTSAEQASASGTDQNLSPVQSGQTSSVQPTYGLGSVNQQAGYGTNALSPTAQGTGGIAPVQTDSGANADLYKPYNDALAYLSNVNRQRQNQSVWSLGKLGAPTGVATLLPGQTPANLPPGMFYDPTQLINSRIGDIKSLQDSLAALGNPGSVESIVAQETPLQNMLKTFGSISDIQQQIAGYGQLDNPAAYAAKQSELDTALARYNQAKDIQTKLSGLGQVGDPGQLSTQIQQLQQEMAPYQAVQDLKTKRQATVATLQNVGSAEQVQAQLNHDQLLLSQIKPGFDQYGNPTMGGIQDPQTGQWVDGAALQAQVDAGKRNLARWQDVVDMDKQLQAMDPTGQAVAVLGQKSAQLDTLKNQFSNAQSSAGLAEQYRNQLSGLVQPGEDVDAALGSLSAQRQGVSQQLADALKVYNTLNPQLANLQASVGGNTEAGVQAQLQGLSDALTRSRKVGDTQTQLANLLAQGVPGAGKLPGFNTGGSITSGIRGEASGIRGSASGIRGEEEGIRGSASGIRGFAGGGNWIAGATSNAHGQFKAKAQAAGMSTRAYANKMADAPGKTGKQARLAKTLMSFAGGGSMVTPEPILGVGMYSGKPRFQVGEPQRPGGPPMQEKLTITPLNRPSGRALPGFSRAA